MEIVDLRKQLADYLKPSAKKAQLVELPDLQFAAVDGVIEPGYAPGTSPAFQNAIQALYSISYTIKFMFKKRKENPLDYPVMALEGLWWVEEGEFDITRPSNWHWTAMIVQPPVVSEEIFQQTLADLKKKKPNPALDRLSLIHFCEGLSVQMMHIGPYSREMETMAVMETYIREQGFRYRGKHHEIYLGDPRKADPQKLRTILRHPVEKADMPVV